MALILRRLWLVPLVPFAVALSACQEKEEGATGAVVATVEPVAIERCVEYVKVNAFLGDAASTEMWNAALRDDGVLAQHCEQLGTAQPEALQQMATDMAALHEATATTAAPPPPSVQPFSAPACDPNYSGACVPVAADVDCAGGSGNGPAYVTGPVMVVGVDVYELDSNGDGLGCEPKNP